jgi:polysaccharide export outer membrane protein
MNFKKSLSLNNLLILFLFLIFESCVSKKQVLLMQDLNEVDISKVTLVQNTIQVNDILKIDVTSLDAKASVPYNKTFSSGIGGASLDLIQLNGYLVAANKTITFPILGEISVSGKTISELEIDLKERLVSGGHLINPDVMVRLLNAKVTILGEVNIPGTYTFTERNITLLQAIGLAGDLTIDGNREDILIIREFDGNRITKKIDLTSSSFLSSPYQNIRSNDVIIVNPNSKKIKSAGLIGNISTMLSIASILLSTIILIR